MRIISGEAKGRQVLYPTNCRARPTADKIREALFNILGPLADESFLDAYAGAGSVGIEALSRGAAHVAFIEKDATLARYTQRNLLLCGLAAKARVIAARVDKGVSLLHQEGILFNIIFADPPYDEGLINETLSCLARDNIIAPNGSVVLQHSVREAGALLCNSDFVVFDQRKYGDTMLSFLTRLPG